MSFVNGNNSLDVTDGSSVDLRERSASNAAFEEMIANIEESKVSFIMCNLDILHIKYFWID